MLTSEAEDALTRVMAAQGAEALRGALTDYLANRGIDMFASAPTLASPPP